jgi:lipopolysaccharide biosynthesis glycosyltransferase
MDADILVQADIKELFDIVTNLRDANGQIPAVSVAKNKARFEWASVMVFNCAHPDNRVLTPEFIETTDKGLHGIVWTNSIGSLPDDWNHLVGYDDLRQVRVQKSVGASSEPVHSTELVSGKSHAKLIHFTQGVPAWPITADSEYSEQWDLDKQFMNSAQDWEKLMGPSVHSAALPDGGVVPKYKLNVIQP